MGLRLDDEEFLRGSVAAVILTGAGLFAAGNALHNRAGYPVFVDQGEAIRHVTLNRPLVDVDNRKMLAELRRHRRVFCWSLGFLLLIPFGVGLNAAGMAVTALLRGAFRHPADAHHHLLRALRLAGPVLLWSALRGLKHRVRIAEWAGKEIVFIHRSSLNSTHFEVFRHRTPAGLEIARLATACFTLGEY